MKYEVIVEGRTTRWYFNGKLHREDGPAIEHPNGSKEWFQNGQRHREDGPAIEYGDGTTGQWYLNGTKQEPPTDNYLFFNGKKYRLTEIAPS